MQMNSIIAKTSLYLGAAITLLLIILGVYFVSSEKSLINEIIERNNANMEQTLEDRKKSELEGVEDYINFVGKTVANVSAEYIYNVDEDGLKLQLQNFIAIKEIKAINVIDKTSNKTFVAVWKENGEAKFGTALPESYKTDKDAKHLNVDSSYQEDVVGSVQIHYTDEYILNKIAKIRKKIESDSQKEQDQISSELATATTLQIIIMASIVAVLVILIVILLNRMVKNPLQILKNAMVDLAENKEGAEADYIDIFRDDEIGEVAKYFNRYITKIVYGSEVDGTLIGDAVDVVEKVKKGNLRNRLAEDKQNAAMHKLQNVVNEMLEKLYENTQDILKTLNAFAKDDYTVRSTRDGIEGEMAELIDGVNFLGESLSTMLAVNLKNGLSLEEDSSTLQNAANVLADTFNEQSQMLNKTTDQLSQMTNELHDNSMKIDAMTTHANDMKAIIGIIGDIADQTNLLALNAAIEAARAGEHGRGFAVVSDEVRKLAEKTQKSLSEINVSINGLVQSVEEVAETFKEQAKGIEEINDTIVQIDNMTQGSTDSTEKVTSISGEISNMAQTLVQDSKSKKFDTSLVHTITNTSTKQPLPSVRMTEENMAPVIADETNQEVK